MKQRIIKFKAWDRNSAKFIGWFRMLKDGFGSYLNNVHYKVLQFTGLKDKNGKEIYEGDIIKTLFMGQKGIIIGEVIWADSGFFVGYKEYKDDLFPWSFYKVVEVIGNKFENPELLKGVKE